MNADGTGRVKLTDSKIDIEGFRFSPDGTKVILIKSLPYHGKKIQKTLTTCHWLRAVWSPT